jgi:activating signal cointegrator 1
MKALSLAQPYATLVALGQKRIETRSWTTRYRGRLAIHASGRMPKENIALCSQPPFRAALEAGGYIASSAASNSFDLPMGAVLAIVTLVDVQRISTENTPGEPEYAFGDYTPGRYAWFLEDVCRLPEPIPAKGKLSLFTLEDPAWDNGDYPCC